MATARALLRRFGTLALNLGSFAFTLLIWSWILQTRFGTPASAAIIVGGAALMVPASLTARRWLDRVDQDPGPRARPREGRWPAGHADR